MSASGPRWPEHSRASSGQHQESPLPPETNRPVLVNRKENPTRQAHDGSRDEAGDAPRQYPGVLLVLVPHVPERVRLPRIHVVDDLVADVSQHLERYLLGEVVKMSVRRSEVAEPAEQDVSHRDIEWNVED